MQLQIHDLSQLYFPKQEWQWLRPAQEYLSEAPDSFVWAVLLEGKLWAWHPRGGEATSLSGNAKVRTLVLEAKGGELEAFGLYLKTSFGVAPAQDVEWTAALSVLKTRFGFDPAQSGLPVYWPEALKACGLEPHLGVLSQRARYLFLNAEERALLFEKKWELATLELFEPLAQPLRSALVSVFRKWNIGAGHAKEICNYILMLNKKFGEKASHTLLSHPHKSAEEFRVAVFQTAQPELATLSRKRIDLLRGLKVPTRTSVFGDPSFEKDLLKITHTPRNVGDVEEFKSWINDAAVAEKLRELLEIYQ
ncbi:MAG: hypothetical protein AB1540_04125 [Bdellovibrionota bacterium]